MPKILKLFILGIPPLGTMLSPLADFTQQKQWQFLKSAKLFGLAFLNLALLFTVCGAVAGYGGGGGAGVEGWRKIVEIGYCVLGQSVLYIGDRDGENK